ncbi:hypothetical protein GV819_22450 [Pseudomonas sp. Fl5BN2]|uniref:4'-phosphopantetheinyl transferase family protein n=1 Tax=unclassified Pseudomonas TaxID=196821 RepID=UPI001377081C|nr:MULTISPECIES: 4'-phosphopantetheinyl transferase superfamily protein [unclassified Pseudomonas]NBF05051.1 hypothetical protein [Pseudomonas sp. Fl5BN2]NBF08733.1 hypothetical protein [Pseudomonas sp. Fl4BN1]
MTGSSSHTALQVFAWPYCQAHWQQGVLLVSVTTGPGDSRTRARKEIRLALREALSQSLGIATESIHIHSPPGQALQLSLPGWGLAGLSISHEQGLSLAAVHLYGAVGVDLMQVEEIPDWQLVAQDYLGPSVTGQLLELTEDLRPPAFAQAWSEREATLKCAGLPLTEWFPLHPPAYRCFALDLPDDWVGTLVLPAMTHH